MQLRAFDIAGAYLFTPRQFPDDRGSFCEWYRQDVLATAIGHPMRLAQVNHSVSRRGVLRGVHFTDVPPGQAKYVYCPHGAVLDVVVDLRVGSATFGRCASAVLDGRDRRAVYLAEGLGHAFMSLADESSVIYLCSTGYAPGRERQVHPLDPRLALPWPAGIEPTLSTRDAAAPTLAQAAAAGALPAQRDCDRLYARLTGG